MDTLYAQLRQAADSRPAFKGMHRNPHSVDRMYRYRDTAADALILTAWEGEAVLNGKSHHLAAGNGLAPGGVP